MDGRRSKPIRRIGRQRLVAALKDTMNGFRAGRVHDAGDVPEFESTNRTSPAGSRAPAYELRQGAM